MRDVILVVAPAAVIAWGLVRFFDWRAHVRDRLRAAPGGVRRTSSRGSGIATEGCEGGDHRRTA